MKGLIEEFGLDGVQAYMHHIQENAELAVTTLLKDIGKRLGGKGQTKVSKQTVRSRHCLEMDRLALPLRSREFPVRENTNLLVGGLQGPYRSVDR